MQQIKLPNMLVRKTLILWLGLRLVALSLVVQWHILLVVGFAPVRKEGKLPRETIKVDYGLEYGSDVLTIHKDAIKPGQRILITDDLLATGGTIQATIQLVEELGGIVAGIAFLIELSELDGRDKLEGYDMLTLMTF